MSPEFRLRPSLSAGGAPRPDPPPGASVAGVQTPAFVERSGSASTPIRPSGRVAGVQTPAFVERSTSARCCATLWSVAGVQTPAFVERRPSSRSAASATRVAGVQTPAFVERMTRRHTSRARRGSVAGVQTPAFVERTLGDRDAHASPDGVAGVQTPAFVERPSSRQSGSISSRVSPGFRLRPSLGGEQVIRCRSMRLCADCGVRCSNAPIVSRPNLSAACPDAAPTRSPAGWVASNPGS